MGDETYLESFIESIATLPHDVRRNLELMKDMDKTCSYVVLDHQGYRCCRCHCIHSFFVLSPFQFTCGSINA